MKPEDRALVLALVLIVAVAGGGGVYVIVFTHGQPNSLPIPIGATFSSNASEQWTAFFDAGPAGGQLKGAWTAYHGTGFVTLIVVNGTVSKPWPVLSFSCPLLYTWSERDGTIDVRVGPGPHTVYWNTGYCAYADEIVVTQAIQLTVA